MSEKTSIQITRETKDRLDVIGLKKDTYDDIIRRLLDQMGVKGRKRKVKK